MGLLVLVRTLAAALRFAETCSAINGDCSVWTSKLADGSEYLIGAVIMVALRLTPLNPDFPCVDIDLASGGRVDAQAQSNRLAKAPVKLGYTSARSSHGRAAIVRADINTSARPQSTAITPSRERAAAPSVGPGASAYSVGQRKARSPTGVRSPAARPTNARAAVATKNALPRRLKENIRPEARKETKNGAAADETGSCLDSQCKVRQMVHQLERHEHSSTHVSSPIGAPKVERTITAASLGSFPIFVDQSVVDDESVDDTDCHDAAGGIASNSADTIDNDANPTASDCEHDATIRTLQQRLDALRALRKPWADGDSTTVLRMLDNSTVLSRGEIARLRLGIGDSTGACDKGARIGIRSRLNEACVGSSTQRRPSTGRARGLR